MKRFPVLTLPVLTLAALTACTPIARGTQPDFPVEMQDSLTPVTVLPGQTVFVIVPYSRAIIEDDNEYDRYFDAIDLDYSGVRSSGDKVPDAYRDAPWFTLKGVDAPAGITVTLVKANIGRIINQTKVSGTSVNVKYGERFRLQYKVSVAADYKAPAADTVKDDDALSPEATAALADLSPDMKGILGAFGPGVARAKLTFADGTGTKSATLRISTTNKK